MFKFISIILLIIPSLLASSFTIAAKEEPKTAIYHITGIENRDSVAQTNVENHLSGLSRDDQLNPRLFKQKVELTVTSALNALGYYNAQITVIGEGLPTRRRRFTSNTENKTENFEGDTLSAPLSVQSDSAIRTENPPSELTPEQKEAILSQISWNIAVTLGKAVHISEVDLTLTGDAERDELFNQTIKKQLPKKGDQLNQGNYEKLKSSLQSTALERGYFDFTFKKTQLEIQPSKFLANYRIEADSGRRYRMGKVTFINSQIDNNRMQSLLDFSEGDDYLLNDLGQLNQTLGDTGWFKSVAVDADLKSANDGVIPINVSVVPDDRNHAEIGLGYSTDLGPRIRGKWEKPWINSHGHRFKMDGMLSKPEQDFNAKYTVPLENVRYNYIDYDININQTDNSIIEGITSNKYTASVTRYWVSPNSDWQTSFWGRWLLEDFTVSDTPGSANLYLIGTGISRVRTRGGVNTTWGDKQSFTIEHSNQLWGSDLSLTQLIGQSSWLRQSGNHRGVFKIQGGTTFINNPDQLPPSLRFFTGGDNTIRGFAYQDISPRDSNGYKVGGTYMLTSSIEYQYRVWSDIWLATFIDSGDAWDKRDIELNNGLGVGIRWASPIGSIRLDVAAGFTEGKYQDYRIHLTLGPEL